MQNLFFRLKIRWIENKAVLCLSVFNLITSCSASHAALHVEFQLDINHASFTYNLLPAVKVEKKVKTTLKQKFNRKSRGLWSQGHVSWTLTEKWPKLFLPHDNCYILMFFGGILCFAAALQEKHEEAVMMKKYQFDGNGNDFRETNLQDVDADLPDRELVEQRAKQANLFFQFWILYQRYVLCSRRNCVSTILSVFLYLLIPYIFKYLTNLWFRITSKL